MTPPAARALRLAATTAATLALVAAMPAWAQSPTAVPAPTFTAERVTLMTHDSFALSPEVLASFEAQTGVALDILTAGDAGSMVNQAILAGDTPFADVLFGVDTTFLSRALDAGIFEAYQPAAMVDVPAELQVDPEGRVTPIDHGDVCINLDLEAFGGEGQPPLPRWTMSLLSPEYRGMLVVQDPATSSPGLAFLLATIANRAVDLNWQAYWTGLRDNDVLVTADWSDAYYNRFSGGTNAGDRPMVVSYASSPVAEVIYADPRPAAPPTGVLEDSCFRQVEYAGVLRGTDAPAEARALVDFLLSPEVQSDIPLNMFVSPALSTAQIPADFAAFAATPDQPRTMDPALIQANREAWIEEWTQLVLR